jgi:hypothetical protein
VSRLLAVSGSPLVLLAVLCGACRSDGADNVTSVEPVRVVALPAAADGLLDVVTYNIAGLPDPLSRSNPASNSARIGQLLNAYDLVLVQEDFWYHAELAASLFHSHRSLPMERFSRLVGDGLNQFSVFPMEPVQRYAWNACSGLWNAACDCLAEKGFTFTRLILDGGAHLGVYNLHADAGRGREDVLARAKQFAQLRDHILDTLATGAVIVAGDFNLDGLGPADESILQELMAATGLIDSCRQLGCKDERFDRMLFRSGGSVALEPVRWTVPDFVDDNGADLSDHKAVNVLFRWSAAAGGRAVAPSPAIHAEPLTDRR